MSIQDDNQSYPRSERTRLRRLHERGSYNKADVHGILDAAPFCHVGYVIDGEPFVTPTIHWRDGERIYWHGSAASRFLRKAQGSRVCVTCTFFDGYVLSRSAFFHSARFRSVMAFGTAQILENQEEKAASLRQFVDGLFPGRWDQLRAMESQELKATAVMYMDIEEATAKTRDGWPNDPDDAAHPVWAGVIPTAMTLGAAENAPNLMSGLPVPDSINALIASGRLR